MSDTPEGDYTEGRMAYIDLLVHTLTQHEKRLDDLINKFEVSLSVKEPRFDSIENIIYTKIEIPYNRPVQELTKILETITSK